MNIFEQAIEEIEKRGWCQGGFESSNGSVCAAGALKAALGVKPTDSVFTLHPAHPAYLGSLEVLAGVVGSPSVAAIAEWNDRLGRTEDEVLEALRKAGKVWSEQ